jgi:hypothetical protein
VLARHLLGNPRRPRRPRRAIFRPRPRCYACSCGSGKRHLVNRAGPYSATAGTGYTQYFYNVSAYAGQAVTLKFTGKQTSYKETSFVIDDTALNIS